MWDKSDRTEGDLYDAWRAKHAREERRTVLALAACAVTSALCFLYIALRAAGLV